MQQHPAGYRRELPAAQLVDRRLFVDDFLSATQSITDRAVPIPDFSHLVSMNRAVTQVTDRSGGTRPYQARSVAPL